MHPSHIAIRNPIFIFIIVVVISLWGYMSYRQIPREAAPDIQIPLLIVTIPFPGASPEDVESLITSLNTWQLLRKVWKQTQLKMHSLQKFGTL